jgi:hypothetical protein
MSVKFAESKRLPRVIEADFVTVKRYAVGGDKVVLDLVAWGGDGVGERTFRVRLDDSDLYGIKRAIVAHAVELKRRAATVLAMPSEEDAVRR